MLDFRSKSKKIVHRWNKNNNNAGKVKENNFDKLINSGKKVNLNVMSAKEIKELFSIKSRDNDLEEELCWN